MDAISLNTNAVEFFSRNVPLEERLSVFDEEERQRALVRYFIEKRDGLHEFLETIQKSDTESQLRAASAVIELYSQLGGAGIVLKPSEFAFLVPIADLPQNRRYLTEFHDAGGSFSQDAVRALLSLVLENVRQGPHVLDGDGLRRGIGGVDRCLDDPGVFERDVHPLRNFVKHRRTPVLDSERRGRLLPLRDDLHHVRRDSHSLDRIDQGALDGLFDPPRGVGTEATLLCGVETFHGLEQTEVALFDQVEKGQASVHVVLGNANNQSKVALGHLVTCGRITLPDKNGQLPLF